MKVGICSARANISLKLVSRVFLWKNSLHPNTTPNRRMIHILKLLNTYDERDDAEDAYALLKGEKRIASERDDTSTIYNIFGVPSWGNFHRIGMYNLKELEDLLKSKSTWDNHEKNRHIALLAIIRIVSKNFSLQIPEHWI